LCDYIRCFSETRISIPNINSDEAISAFIRGRRHHDALRAKLPHKRPDSVQDLLTVAKKWADADEADQQIKEDVGQAPRPDQQNATQTTGAMIGVVTIAVMIGSMTTVTALTTIVIGVGRMTLGGGRVATDQLITPSMPSSQRPSAIMRMLIPMSFRVPALLIRTLAIQWGIAGV
jgi:hypothetical protein